MSFRRQIYVDLDDAQKIPESFLITHDDTQYRIFVSTNKVNCFLYKQEEHIAKQCTLHIQPIMSNLTNNREINSSDIPKEMEQTLSSSNTQETTSIPHKNQTETENQERNKNFNTTTDLPTININNTLNDPPQNTELFRSPLTKHHYQLQLKTSQMKNEIRKRRQTTITQIRKEIPQPPT